jgi:hypothetical protein
MLIYYVFKEGWRKMANYVIFVHGIGEQQPGYSSDFAKCLAKVYTKELKTKKQMLMQNELVFEECYWADVTQPDEQQLIKREHARGMLRKLMLGSIGGATAYSDLPSKPNRFIDIQARFTASIIKVSKLAQDANDGRASLIVIAHSLGTVIASDGIYRLGQKGQMPANLDLQCFFSMGSPIVLYGLRYGLDNFTQPIKPKSWINFCYTQDLIAYPLKQVNSAYAVAVKEDIILRPGSSYNLPSTVFKTIFATLPLGGIFSHSWYWKDPRVITKIARTIAVSVINK